MAKYAQKGLRMHLLQSRISKFSGGPPPYPPPTREGEPPSRALPPLGLRRSGSCLRHSTLPLLYKLRLLLQFFSRALLCFRLNIKQLISNKNQEVSGKLHHKINL